MRNREVQIKFYATEKERESIRRNAKRAGMKWASMPERF